MRKAQGNERRKREEGKSEVRIKDLRNEREGDWKKEKKKKYGVKEAKKNERKERE